MKIIDTQGRNVSIPTVIEPTGRIFSSRLPNVGTAFTTLSGSAHLVYVGRMAQQVVVKYIEYYVSTIGSPASIVQVGMFTTPNPPNKTSQGTNGVTKLIATGDTDIVVTLGLKRNTDPFNYAVPAGTYLWAGIRTALTSTQPALAGLCMDFSEGMALNIANAGDLSTTAGPWTATLPSLGAYLNSAVAPDLRVTLD